MLNVFQHPSPEPQKQMARAVIAQAMDAETRSG
jgi:hypothetical protein